MNEDIAPTLPDGGVFHIAVSQPRTRTAVDDGFAVGWQDGDSIRVSHSPAGENAHVDDGLFVYHAATGLFSGHLAAPLATGAEYDWKVAYPYVGQGGDELLLEHVQHGSGHDHLAGAGIPLEGELLSCDAATMPSVQMHQRMSALELRLTASNVEAFKPVRIELSPWAGSTCTLVVKDAEKLSWDHPGTYYMPVPPLNVAKGTSMLLRVYYSSRNWYDKELVFDRDRSFDAGEITPIDVALEPRTIGREELFSAENWDRVMKELERFYNCGPNSDRAAILKFADGLVSRMKPDGSWPDIDYGSYHQSNWSPVSHSGNMRDIARAYHLTHNEKYLNACRKALEYWDNRKPWSLNWWFNEIGAPMVFAPTFLLLKEGFDSTDLQRANRVLSKTQLGMTGQNKVWVAGIVLERGLLNEDYDMVMRAYEDIFSEIRLTTDEGIQPDYSFHQHGRIMQTGVYGLVFAQDMAKWYSIFKGTPLAIVGEKKEILTNYLLEGQDWMVWKGYYDLNGVGRQVMSGKELGNTATVMNAHSYMEIPLSNPIGGKYYPYSDFGAYRSSLGWCASIRMQSNHLQGFENTLSENMLGYFCSDGVLLVRCDGTEYLEIGPLWNWKRLPGTTTYDDGKPLWGCNNLPPYNRTDKVFGQVFGDGSGDKKKDVMVAAMDYNRDGLTARKAWFFFDKGVLCLGSGITMNKGYRVTTTVEQNLKNGVPQQYDNWVRHRGVTYVNLGEGQLEYSCGTRTGRWSDLCTDYEKTQVTKDVFELTLDHGVDPSDASYAYGLSPWGSYSVALGIFEKDVRVLSNSKDCQSASVYGITYTIDWNSCTITASAD